MAVRALVFMGLFLAIMAGTSSALDMEISVKESIQGYVAWFSLSNDGYQAFSTGWNNIGSVNCLSRPRIDMYTLDANGSLDRMVYTVWGQEETSFSGSSSEWTLFSGLPEGEYAAVLRMYHCNEIFEQEPYVFTAPGIAEGQDPAITEVQSGPGRLDVHVSGSTDAVVVPEDYPSGWIFQSARVEDGRAVLDFVPVGDLPTSITLRVVDASGSSSVRKVSISPLQEPQEFQWGTALILAALLFFALYVSRNIIKIWRR